jgi:YidC/Oxa1 family membrane protein insertase
MSAVSMFEGFYEFISTILAWFYGLFPSYGMAITLLTITVMIVITPLTLKSTRSMLQMQRLQPELKRIQEKYKGDRERLNTELMAFYKEHQLNPLSGCVPILLQAPIFFLMYQVLRGLTERAGGQGSGAGHAVGQMYANVPFTPWRYTDQPFRPNHLSESTELYQSLIGRTKMNFLGMDLAISPREALAIGIGTAIPFIILMVLMLVSQIIQNRQIQGRNTGAPVNPQQQMIMKVLPFMLPVISFSFPAGLGLYYFVQGLCRMGTQAYITRKFYGDNALAPIETTSPSAGANGSESDEEPKVRRSPPEKKSGSSVKSRVVQEKKQGSGARAGGRKSGDPRRGAAGGRSGSR